MVSHKIAATMYEPAGRPWTGRRGPAAGALEGGRAGWRETENSLAREPTVLAALRAGGNLPTHHPLPHITSEDDDSGDPRAAVLASRPSSTRGLDQDGPGAGGHEASGRSLETDLPQYLARVRLLDGRTEEDTM